MWFIWSFVVLDNMVYEYGFRVLWSFVVCAASWSVQAVDDALLFPPQVPVSTLMTCTAPSPFPCHFGCMQGDLGAVPQAFHEARHDDVLAVVHLTWMSYGAGRHAISTRSIIKTMLWTWAAKLLPWLVARPALTLMNETNLRYCDILKRQEFEEQVLGAAAAGVEAVGIALAVTVLVFGCSSWNGPMLG